MNAGRKKTLLLLAPLAAVLGMFLAHRGSNPAQLQLAVTRPDVVQKAHAQAAAKGIRTDGWSTLVALHPHNDLRHYLTRTATPAESEAIRRLLEPIPYRCLLVPPEHVEDAVRITVAADGRLLSYKVPPSPNTPSIPEPQARSLAEAELQRRLGNERNGFTFASAGVRQHDVTKSEIRNFRFRRDYGRGFGIEATIETSGTKVIRFALDPKLPPDYTKRFPELRQGLQWTRGITFVLVILGGFIYIVARFVRRLREHEIPLKRTAIIAFIVFIAFIGSTSVGGAGQQMDQIENGTSSPPAVQLVMTIVISAIMGAFIGMTWGATEADLREAYPEKLTSIDALLGGHLFSRPVRSSIATGLALGAYGALLSSIEPFLRLPRAWNAVAEELGPYQSTYPALALVLFAFVGLPITMAWILTAISITHRHGATRNAKIGLFVIVLIFFTLSTAGTHAPIAWGLVFALISTAVMLLPFFLGDVLSVIVSVTFSLWLIGSASLIAQPSASLRAGGWALAACLAAAIVLGALVARSRRDEPEAIDSDRPQYARNIAERLLLRSEMDAARQAQLRVMPRVVPQVEGVQLAAQHAESAEIGSDYFEFFPTPTHVSVAVADARMPGLSSALCVSMLKGLLLNYAGRVPDTRDVADRVYRQLASIFGDDLPLSFFYGRLDRATGGFSFATFGSAPRAVMVRDGEATSLEGEEYVQLAANDALVIYTARLADLRDRDGAALGDEALQRELGTHGHPQQLADALHDLATRHVRGVETPQSWAAVALGRAS